MCYGSLDPKYAMRDTEARLKGVSFHMVAGGSETEHPPASAPAFGLVAWMRAAAARLKWKDRAHV